MEASPPLGCPKSELDTPALCVDLDAMESNIRAMVEACRAGGVDWRPHAKCHKSPLIGRMLIEAGAIGLTCAKLGEAEVMAAGGITDLLIANYIVGRQKIARLVELRRIADPIVCIDHPTQAEAIGAAMQQAGLRLRVLIEVDIGLHRAGVIPGAPTLELARKIVATGGLLLAGVMGYEGHLLTLSDPEDKQRQIHAALQQVVQTKRLLESSGIACPIVSCGGTGSYEITLTHEGVNELQAGGAIFMDAFYRRQCHVRSLQYAMTVLATVVSTPAPHRAIIDAGRKTLNKEIQIPEVVGRNDITVESLSAEHGTLRLSPGAEPLRIGDRLELIPGYSDLTTVLHDEM
ncbi:MAG: DSD1 family PLP-dependent enzyme [Planctomycetes bacterium]|nr:DSD1 family PLP-dependent enzyme [Planctomycetota bacterium]